jgi:Fe-S-cluster containining protein
MSGTVPIGVSVILVAAFEGACPHLGPDMLCGIYDERPRVCRIYPAEISPRALMVPEQKACPPEAWSEDRSLLTRDGTVVDDELSRLIETHRTASLLDVGVLSSLCQHLDITSAAFANEGYAVYSPAPTKLVEILTAAMRDGGPEDALRQWAFATNRGSTLRMLEAVEGLAFACV